MTYGTCSHLWRLWEGFGNVYKSGSEISLAIRRAVAPFPKVLLNGLLELCGLLGVRGSVHP
jgi:hypothetical protein